jgi:hypothetical protein
MEFRPPVVLLLTNFATFYGTPKVPYRSHKSPPPVPILSQISPVHTSSYYLCKINFNIMCPSTF